MVKGFLEERITTALESQGLIENNRNPIAYKPDEKGYGYKRFRHWFVKNIPTIGIAGIGVAALGVAAAEYYNHEALARNITAGIGAASVTGVAFKVFKPLDRWLKSDPEDIAARYFDGVDVPWREAYEALTINSKKELEGYVYLAQTADSIVKQRMYHETQLALGIAIAKTADYLSQLKFDSKLSGLGLDDTIEMLVRQKVGTEKESRIIAELRKRHSSKKLSNFIHEVERGKMDVNSVPGLHVLYDHLKGYEFILRTTACGSLESIGSQISKGELMLTNNAGPNAASYAGMYSEGKDFPRIKIKADASHSLATHSSRLLAIVGGNVGQGAFEEATGIIGIVEGTAGHHFCHKMDDRDWPSIGITVGGLNQRLDEVKNGLVISLAEDKLLRNSGETACAYRFRNGVKEKIPLSMGENDELHHEAPEALEAVKIAEDYIAEWASTHKAA